MNLFDYNDDGELRMEDLRHYLKAEWRDDLQGAISLYEDAIKAGWNAEH